MALLQWGRNLFVAECDTSAYVYAQGLELQWGRNLFVAEWQVWMTMAIIYAVELQWGRNLFVAECIGGHRPGRSRPPASMGPQLVRCGMDIRGPAAHAIAAAASMGPQLVRCGMLYSRAFVTWISHASMGPQLVRCGMQTLHTLGCCHTPGFNGAATCSLRNAERDGRYKVRRLACFNGAATCSLRNDVD